MIEKNELLRHTDQQFTSHKPSIPSNNNPVPYSLFPVPSSSRLPTPDSLLPLLFRSLALFALLYQLRFIADDLADTAVFSAALFIAVGAGLFISEFRIKGKKLSRLRG
jgi:hypothetical protein